MPVKTIRFTSIALLLIFAFTNLSFAIDKNSICKKWLTQDKDSIIEIYQKNNKYYGKIIWIKEEKDKSGKIKLDKNNPDKSKRKNPIKGILLLKDFEFDGNDQWENGTIYDPRDGETYSCKISFDDDKKLKVRGYLGLALFGKTVYWTEYKKK